MIVHKVFLSSTWRDMADRRAAVLRAVRLLDGFDVEAMEEFGLRPQPPLDVCLMKVAGCNVFFGVLGAAYGSSPPAGDPSYTEREYDEAERLGLPRLMVVVDDEDVADPRQEAFRKRVMRDLTAKQVRGESADFSGVLAVTALVNLVKAKLTDRFETYRRIAEDQDRKLGRLERAIAGILKRSRAAMQALLDSAQSPIDPALSDQALSQRLARALMRCQPFSEAITWLGTAYRDCDDRGDQPARQALSKVGGHLLPWVYVAGIDGAKLEKLRAETQADVVRLPCGLNSFAEIVLAGLVPRPGRFQAPSDPRAVPRPALAIDDEDLPESGIRGGAVAALLRAELQRRLSVPRPLTRCSIDAQDKAIEAALKSQLEQDERFYWIVQTPETEHERNQQHTVVGDVLKRYRIWPSLNWTRNLP
jgi:hypothetical protein